jgi:hypothetical protein
MIAVIDARKGVAWLLCALTLTGCSCTGRAPVSPHSPPTTTLAWRRAGRTDVGEGQILVKLDVYRGCLKARGWQRETGSLAGNPPGFYRGLEDEGSIRVGDVPSRSGRPRGRAWETGGPGRITSNSRTGVSRVALGDTFFCTGSSFLLYVCREVPGHQHRLRR